MAYAHPLVASAIPNTKCSHFLLLSYVICLLSLCSDAHSPCTRRLAMFTVLGNVCNRPAQPPVSTLTLIQTSRALSPLVPIVDIVLKLHDAYPCTDLLEAPVTS
jgi:hypothetical protein